MVETIVRPLGKKVYAIVNYDNFTIAPDVLNEYTYMVKGLVDRFYTHVTRYTTSTFLRMKLGDALERRNVSPHIYESRAEAQQALGISSKVENA
jgi:propionate CoA-transferase